MDTQMSVFQAILLSAPYVWILNNFYASDLKFKQVVFNY